MICMLQHAPTNSFCMSKDSSLITNRAKQLEAWSLKRCVMIEGNLPLHWRCHPIQRHRWWETILILFCQTHKTKKVLWARGNCLRHDGPPSETAWAAKNNLFHLSSSSLELFLSMLSSRWDIWLPDAKGGFEFCKWVSSSHMQPLCLNIFGLFRSYWHKANG